MLVGLLVSARNRDGELKLASPRKRVKDVLRRTSLPIAWWQDGLSLFIYRPGELPAKISRLELTTGRKTALEQLMPGDPAGVETIGPILLTPDGKTCVYGYHRTLSDLYLVEGLK